MNNSAVIPAKGDTRMKTLLLVIGARPQFVKVAMLASALKHSFRVVTVHTGQHYDADMSDSFLKTFELSVDFNLGINQCSNDEMLGRMLPAISEVIRSVEPDGVVVFGDTTSTLAAALSARYLKVPLVHYEAGLRSFDLHMPEEVNRVCADQISDVLLCASPWARDRLIDEKVSGKIHFVGDIMLDTLIAFSDGKAPFGVHGVRQGEFTLVTIHRPSNTDNPENLLAILGALKEAEDEFFLFPLHPRTRAALERYGALDEFSSAPNIKMTGPLPYSDFILLLKGAKRVVTDSGGIQKEAHFLRVPCVTCRTSTEWKETLENEWNVLTGPDHQTILTALRRPAPDPSTHSFPYGSGDTTSLVVDILERTFQGSDSLTGED